MRPYDILPFPCKANYNHNNISWSYMEKQPEKCSVQKSLIYKYSNIKDLGGISFGFWHLYIAMILTNVV